MASVRSSRPALTKTKLLRYAVYTVIVLSLALTMSEATHLTHFLHRKPAAASSGPTPAQQKEQAAAAADQKKQAIENPTPAAPSDQTTVENAKLSLTAHQESNGTVTVLTNLGAIPDGTCTLTITNGSKTTSQAATVIYQPQYSTCAGFSVPVSSVGTGTWTLQLSVASQGATVSKTATLEVH